MAKIIYATNTSLDGYIEDAEGKFDFGFPSPEVHQFINDAVRDVGTHILGRKLYETMGEWETMDVDNVPEDTPQAMRDLQPQSKDFKQIWIAADKIVYSTTLEEVWTARTELRSVFDVDALRAFKESADADAIIGGAGLASSAFAAGLIDEVHQIVFPVTVGAGKPAFPTDQSIELELIDLRRFEDGVVHLKYGVA